MLRVGEKIRRTFRTERVAKRQLGAVAVESAISFAALLFLVFGGIELTRASYTYAQLNLGLLRAAKFVKLAVKDVDDTDGILTVQRRIETVSNTRLSEFKMCEISQFPCTISGNQRGAEGQWLRLEATKSIRIFGVYNVNLRQDTVVRNPSRMPANMPIEPGTTTYAPSWTNIFQTWWGISNVDQQNLSQTHARSY